MRTLLVTYDLRQPLQNYTGLLGRLRASGAHWHCLESTWLIRTTLEAPVFRDQLLSEIDRSDVLLVMDVTGDGAAWFGLSADCSQWLKDNLA